MRKILIIEDDEVLLSTLTSALEAENFKVDSAMDGEQGFELGKKGDFDLICVDWMLPSLSGLEICRKLRSEGIHTPLIFITGEKKEEIDKVLGLELGADDYIIKPFGTREFIARIKAVLRRSQPVIPEIEKCVFGNNVIDFKKQTLTNRDTEYPLTAKELELLKYMSAFEGEVLSRDRILNQVWGYETFPTTRTVDTFIHNLRKKIEDDPSDPKHLVTVPWSGYKFVK